MAFGLRRRVTSALSNVLAGRGAAGATVQTFVSRFAVLGANVLTGVLTARSLGAEGRGELVAIGIVVTFLCGLSTFGLPTATIYTFKRYPAQRSGLFTAGLLIIAMVTAVVAPLGVAVVPLWLDDFPPSIQMWAQLFLLQTPIILLVPFCHAALEAEGEFKLSNTLRFATPLISLVLLSALAVSGYMTPITAALAYCVAGLGPLAWMLIALGRRHRPRLRGVRTPFRRLTGFGFRTWGIDFVNAVASQADQVIVVALLSPSLVGIYVVALSAARILSVIGFSVVTVLYPRTASRPQAEVVAMVGRAARWVATVGAIASVAAILLGPYLLRLLYGPEFVPATPLLRILIIEVFLSGLTLVLVQSFIALARPGWVTLLQAVGMAISVPLMLVLVPRFGLMGAGYALLCSTTARLVLTVAAYPLILRSPAPSCLLTLADLRFVRDGPAPEASRT